MYVYICLCTNDIVYVYTQTKFTWDPQHYAAVRKMWKEKTRMRVKDLVNKALNEDPNKIITWMTEDLRARLRHKREHDEVFKKRFGKKQKEQGGGLEGENWSQRRADLFYNVALQIGNEGHFTEFVCVLM